MSLSPHIILFKSTFIAMDFADFRIINSQWTPRTFPIYVRFTKNISHLQDIHATNVAIQKTAPNYDSDKGCKWLLRNLKLYLTSKHGKEVVDLLFTEMEALIVRSLMSVQKVMINDKHCFELCVFYLFYSLLYRYGYDILIDDNLKPWVFLNELLTR